MNIAATNWLAFTLPFEKSWGSAALSVSFVIFAGQIPQLFISPLAGVWIDRLNRRSLLLATQSLSMIQSFAVMALLLNNEITLQRLIALSLVQGLINSFDGPARQSLYVELLDDRKHLSNALSLNSTIVHLSRFLGPALAGLIIYNFGVAMCFFIDGLSYAAVLLALYMLQLRPRISQLQVSRKILTEFKEGLAYVRSVKPIFIFLIFSAVISFFAMSESALLPSFASQVLNGNEKTYGLLVSAAGLGALMASLYLTVGFSKNNIEKLITTSGVGLGTFLVLFALSRNIYLSFVLNLAVGGCLLFVLAGCNIVLQNQVEDQKRGRVMALAHVAFLGMAPLGSLWGGAFASRIGVPAVLILAGAACFIASLVLAKNFYPREVVV